MKSFEKWPVTAPARRSHSSRATMLGLDKDQRRLVAEKVFDFANLAAAGMVIGEIVGDHAFSGTIMVTGIAMWMAAMVICVSMVKGRRP